MSVYDYRFGPRPPALLPKRDQTTTYYNNFTCPRRCGRVMPTDKRLVWNYQTARMRALRCQPTPSPTPGGGKEG